MDNQDVLVWIEPLVTAPYEWRETGSSGGIRANTLLRRDDRPVEYLNLVTALAAIRGGIFHSGEYHEAAEKLDMPQALANAMIRAGDNNLPESHEFFMPLARLVNFLANGGSL